MTSYNLLIRHANICDITIVTNDTGKLIYNCEKTKPISHITIGVFFPKKEKPTKNVHLNFNILTFLNTLLA